MRRPGAAGTLAVLLALAAGGQPLAAQTAPGAAIPQAVPGAAPVGVAAGDAAPPGPSAPVQPAPLALPAAAPGGGVLGAALLTIDQDALYRESRWGQRAQAELEARSRAVATENDRIAAELEAADDDLTALRPTLPPDEFRRRADAFDTHVQQVRQEREQVGRKLLEQAEQDRAAFLNAALPLFTAILRERGAVAILDRRTVFLSADAVDITAAMIGRIDAQLGDGAAATDQGATDQGAGDQGRAGPAGQGAAGPDGAAPDRAGPDEAGPDGAGQDGAGPAAGQPGAAQVAPDPAAADSADTDPAGPAAGSPASP